MLSRPPLASAASSSRSTAASSAWVSQDLLDPALADLVGQAVAAQQHAVAEAKHHRHHVGVGGVVGVDRAQHDVAPRVDHRLGLGHPALVAHLLHPGVVAAQPGEPAVAEQVGARVADVREREPLAVGEQRGQCGRHAAERRVVPHAVAHLALALRDGAAEHAGRAQPDARQGRGGDDVSRGGRGDLARGVAADTVGNEHQGRPGEAGVLVARAHESDVRAAGGREAHHLNHLRRRTGAPSVCSVNAGAGSDGSRIPRCTTLPQDTDSPASRARRQQWRAWSGCCWACRSP